MDTNYLFTMRSNLKEVLLRIDFEVRYIAMFFGEKSNATQRPCQAEGVRAISD
jgi:hypothetical protein